ncbi:hypothetical protein LTR28_007582, partial [Elasticomyces elasticus]
CALPRLSRVTLSILNSLALRLVTALQDKPGSRYATDMYVHRHEHFRWTPRTAWITFAYVVAVPSMFWYMAYSTEVHWIYLLYIRDTSERKLSRSACK